MNKLQVKSGGKSKGKVHAYVAGGSVGNIRAFQAGGSSPAFKQLQANIAKEDRKTSLSAARKAGHLYYWKDGKKMAAVFAEDLTKTGLSLRDFMNKQLGKSRKAPVPRKKPKQRGETDLMKLSDPDFIEWHDKHRRGK